MALPDLVFRITAQASTAAAFAATKAEVAGLRGEMTGLATSAKLFLGSFAAGFGIAGLQQLASSVVDVVDKMKELELQSKKIGVTTTALQELHASADDFNVDAQTLDEALGTFAKNIAEAAVGGGKLAPILKANGVALKDAHGNMIPVLDQLLRFADLVKNARSEEDKILLTTDAFGKGNQDLVTFLEGGSDALRQYMAEAKATGKVLEEDLVKKGADTAKDWDDLTQKMTTGWETFVLSVVNGVADIITQIQKLPTQQRQALSFGIAGGSNPVGIAMPGTPQGAGIGSAAGAALGDAHAAATAEQVAAAKANVQEGLFELAHRIDKPTVIPDANAAADKKKIDDVIAALKLEDANLTRTARSAAIYNALARAGTTDATALGKQVEQLAGKLYDDQKAQEALNNALDFFGTVAEGEFESLITGAKSFKDVLKDVIVQLEQAALKAALLGQGPLAGAFGLAPTGSSGVGGLFGALASFLPHFATGGSFTVGGSGGVDSKVVSFLATPGESVTVAPPGTGGSGVGAIQHLLRIELNDQLLDARIVRTSGPVALELYKNGQKMTARRQEREG